MIGDNEEVPRPGIDAGLGARDDRILPIVRVVAVVVMVILLLAWVVLFGMPDETERWFAWTVEPTMTSMLMGAGYGSAIYFFVRVLTERRWHRVALGFVPTTVFVWMMLGATLLHWDRFHHGSLSFWLWLWAYIVVPLALPPLWLVNRRHDPGTARERDGTLPPWTRGAMAGAGAGMLAISAWMYVAPLSAVDVWPWMLTPLTARAVAAFVALPAVAWLAIAADGRWSAARVMLTTVAIGLVLLLVAVGRAWEQFDHSDPLSFVYVAGLVGTLVAIATLAARMRLR